MTKMTIAKEIAVLVKDIEMLDSKVTSMSTFATRLLNSSVDHVEMGLEEFDFDNVPSLQFIPAPMTEYDDPKAEPKMIGYQKLFTGTEDVNMYNVILDKGVAMTVINAAIGKMNAQKQTKQNELDSLLPGERTYRYSVSPDQIVVPVTVNKKPGQN